MEEVSSVRVQTTLQRLTRNALLVALVAHVIFGVVAGFIVAIRSFNKPQAMFTPPDLQRPRLEPKKLEMKVRVQDLQKRSARPKLQPRLTANRASEISLPKIKKLPKKVKRKVKTKFSVTATSGFGDGIGGGDGFGSGGGNGAGTPLPRLLNERCSTASRLRALKKYGGDPSSEVAVVKGLRYLKSIQNEDGSFGHEHKGAMTGIALLAFLGHCETPKSLEFGKTVQAAIDYLVLQGKKNKGFLHVKKDGHGPVYAHGIAAYALAEAYAMTKDPDLRSPVRKSISIITKGQTGMGGWVYGYAEGGCDMSVASWQIQALKAAEVGGVTSTRGALSKAASMLSKHQKSNGSFSYRLTDAGHLGLTGPGTLCLQIAGKGKSKAGAGSSNGVAYILQQNWGGYGGAQLYYWYYNTLACFNAGGPDWKKWHDVFARTTTQAQNGNGSWPSSGGALHMGGGGGQDGEVWRTSMCCLMLEVYYRYLPSS